MSYLLDKKSQRKKIINISLLVVFLILILYFRGSILNKLSSASHFITRPIFYVGNGAASSLGNLKAYFVFKSSLLQDKENLANTLAEKMALYSNYMSILDENNKMKEILGRKNPKINMILAGILAKPNQSPYDTLIIDTGGEDDISIGARVFALGNVPIGRVVEVYSNSAKVNLFSNPGERTEVVIRGKDIFMQLIGRGGGNFEMASMKDLTLEKGTEVLLPGINAYVVATVEKNISDPRDSFDKILLVSPVNIQELKFVQVERKSEL